jgi:hypothetical protein
MDTNIIDFFQDKRIEIINDRTYTYNSNDNLHNYVVKYFSDDLDYYTSQHGIFVKNNDQILHSAIVFGKGGLTSVHKNSYCIEDDSIIICCGNTLFSLKLFELTLNWKIKIDDVTAFGIYKMNNDFIVHGELQISRINKDGKIIWQKNGSDIFLTINGQNDFEIIDQKIYVESWDGRKYKFDYNGKDENN